MPLLIKSPNFTCFKYITLLFFNIKMSVNSTPRGNSYDNIPIISPVEYFNAQKIQSSIPCLAIKKISEIIDEYFKLKPQLTKKENDIKTLSTYNEKMLNAIQTFIQHEKKVVRKYNKLCQIYAKHFKQYWNAKNVDINFKDLINPITCISETFSVNDWKVQIQDNPLLTVTPKYEELLLNSIKKHYLNEGKGLQAMLEKELSILEKQNSHQPQNLAYIRQQIRQLNTTAVTVHNMFDLLEKRKNIEILIKEMDDKYQCEFTFKDLNFIDEVTRIHSIINNPTPQKLRQYLEHEAQIRRSLKKKSRKFRENLQLQFQRIETENIEIKQQIDQIKRKNQELEDSRNDFRNKYQYMQLKVGANNNKKQKDKNSSNTSIIEDTLNMGIKQTNKKLQIKISQLETQIGQLKQQILDKQQANKHLNVKRQLMNSNSQMEELRLKLCSKLMELGIVDTQAMTSGEMFDKVMERQLGIKHYEVRDPTDNKNHEYIDIKITESLPISQTNKHSLQTPPQINQSIIEKQPSLSEQNKKSQPLSNHKTTVFASWDKDNARETQTNEFKATTQPSQEPPVYNVLMAKSQKIKENLQKDHQNTGNIQRKKSYNAPLSSSALLSISQRKSVEQQSKLHDVSKIFKDNKSIIDQKNNIKNQQHSKQIQEFATVIKKLQDKNRQLMIQHDNLRKQIDRLQDLLTEKKKKTLSAFESIEKDLDNIDKDHAGQIYNICQSLVRQLQKLQGEDFAKMMANVVGVIKNFKPSSSNLHPNMNQIPILSKNLTEQEDNLFKSQNLIAQLFGGKKQEANKRRFSMPNEDKSGRLSLNSGEVKFQIKHEKSIYFGNKDAQQLQNQSKAHNANNSINQQESSIKIDQDQLIDIVNDFEGRSRKKNDNNNSQNSLKFSQSNIKYSRQLDIRSSIKIMDKIDRKIVQDTQFMMKIEQKLEEIKDNSQSGHDLYWFYKRYRQAMEALENTEAKLLQFQRKKDACMNQLIEEDANLSKHKLEEKIYFLQQRVKQLQDRLLVNKEEYENNMTEKIKGIDDLKENAIAKLIKGIFSEKYSLVA